MKRKKSLIYVAFLCLFVALLFFIFLDTTNESNEQTPYSILGAFPIGIFWQPGPNNTTYEKYKELKDMHVNFIMGTNGVDHFQTNDAALVHIAANDLKIFATDAQFRQLPPDEFIDSVANHYILHPAVIGFNLYDEPSTKEMMKLSAISKRLKTNAPNHSVLVNLFPNYATEAQLFALSPNSREEVRPDQSLGQTFRTGDETLISTIQLWISSSQWEKDEKLTLTLWSSPDKKKVIAQHTLAGSEDSWPQFTLNAKVKPNTMYYMELTHDGGGDQKVSQVYLSKLGEKWFDHGTAFINGVPIEADLWFTINQHFRGNSYEDYVYRWVRTKPDVLLFDYYPFQESKSVTGKYYENMEIIRRQSLAGSVDFWTYIQSVGLNGMLRSPTQDELRFHIYSNLVYGAKGYIYFTYETPVNQGTSVFHEGIILPDGSKSPLYDWAKQLNSEVLNLGPTLMSLTSKEVYHSGESPNFTTPLPKDFFWQLNDPNEPFIIGYFTDPSGCKYVMAVNRDWRDSRHVQFLLPDKPDVVKEISKETGKEKSTDYDSITGLLSSDFAAGEGRLYVLPKGY